MSNKEGTTCPLPRLPFPDRPACVTGGTGSDGSGPLRRRPSCPLPARPRVGLDARDSVRAQPTRVGLAGRAEGRVAAELLLDVVTYAFDLPFIFKCHLRWYLLSELIL